MPTPLLDQLICAANTRAAVVAALEPYSGEWALALGSYFQIRAASVLTDKPTLAQVNDLIDGIDDALFLISGKGSDPHNRVRWLYLRDMLMWCRSRVEA